MKSVFKALNDPTRRGILDMLKERDLTAGEIADAFDMTKPSISHHLSLLQQADLVMTTKEGKFIRYALNTTVLEEAVQWMLALIQAQPDTNHEAR